MKGPPLETRRLKLRPADDLDLPFLYDLATGSESGWRWRWRGYVPTQADVVTDLASESLLVFMLDDKKARERVGLLHAYGASLHDGYVYVGVIVAPQYVSTGWGLEGFFLFVNYLFTIWDLRKVYVELPDFNVEQAAIRESELFEMEGRFKDHHYYDGRHWDKHTWAFTHDTWQRVAKPLIERLAV